MLADRYRVGCSVVVLVASVLVIGAAAGCSYLLLHQPDPRELERVASPDGNREAVLLLVPPRFGGGGAAGSTGHYELFVVEAGEDAKDLPRPLLTNCERSGPEGTLQTCQEPADLPGSDRRLLITDDHLRSAGHDEYEIAWQDERTLEFRNYKAGEVFRFGCGPDPRELLHLMHKTWATKMPDEVCAAGNASPETT